MGIKIICSFGALFFSGMVSNKQLNIKPQDGSSLIHPFNKKLKAFKKSLPKTSFPLKGDGLFLYAIKSFNLQNINNNGVISPIKHVLSSMLSVKRSWWRSGWTSISQAISLLLVIL